ncbi:MAG: hypothetical protein ACRES7_08790, partial [Gammaproteobacteria bacterium]
MNVPGTIGLKAFLSVLALAGGGALALAAPINGAAAGAADHPNHSTQALPAGLRPALYQALAKDAGPAYAIGKDGCATLPKQSLTACFTKDGTRFSGKNAPALALHLASYGRGDQLMSVKPVAPTNQANRAAYAHGNVTEWWRVLPMGFEQGFTVEKRPAGNGELTLALTTSREAASHGENLGWGKLSYGKLVVTDANGHVVSATLKNDGNRILIAVNDAHAVYPLTVDPLVWIEQEIGADSYSWGQAFGVRVAYSGATAFAGAPVVANKVFVFNESNGSWTLTQTLTPSDDMSACFGGSLATDGTTLLIGAPATCVDNGQGAAYVFTYANGSWTEAQKLIPTGGGPNNAFGSSVALDGTTALIGAKNATVNANAGQGAAFVFSDSGGTWSQTQMLTANDGAAGDALGSSVALDGTTAIVGAPLATAYGIQFQGAAYVFNNSGGTWSQTQKLTESDGNEIYDEFGYSVALAGSTAMVGAIRAGPGSDLTGYVYVYGEAGGSWSETQTLTATSGIGADVGDFGSAIVLDGGTALIGADQTCLYNYFDCAGSAYLFADSDGTWSQTHEFFASDGEQDDEFGASVAWNGTTALIGAPAVPYGDLYVGAIYFDTDSDLDLALSAPQTVLRGHNFVSQTIATNNATAGSVAMAVKIHVPAAATLVSASASQGSCTETSGTVTCAFGQIAADGATATANVTLKATGEVGTTIENTASVAKATPALTASAPTTITTA